MEFKVRLFLGDELIDPSDYDTGSTAPTWTGS